MEEEERRNGEMNDRQLEEIFHELKRLNNKVDAIHTALFGVEGAGGLHRWVTEINRKVDLLNDEFHIAKGRTLGVAAAVSFIVAVVGLIIGYITKG